MPKYNEDAIFHNNNIKSKTKKFNFLFDNIKIIRKKRGRSDKPIKYSKEELINIKNLKT